MNGCEQMVRRGALRLWSAAYLLNEAEPAMVRRLPAILRGLDPDWPVRETVGLDVGASVGVYALAMSRWCARVLALEPNPAMAAMLRQTAIPGVEVVEAAASSRDGEGVLADNSESGLRRPEARLAEPGSGAWRTPCRLVHLDGLLDPPPALVAKIDVEGHEGEVLAGMGRLMDVPRVLLVIEIEERHNPRYAEVFRFLAERGFTAWRWTGRGLTPATADDTPRAESFTGGRFARLRGYRANFVFLKTDCPETAPHNSAP